MITSMDKTLVIILHGSGSDGASVSSLIDHQPLKRHNNKTLKQLTSQHNIDFITPTAPLRPYANNDFKRVWHDRASNYRHLGRDDKEDSDGVNQSVHLLSLLIYSIEDSYDYIIIGGLSMGGGMALRFLKQRISPKIIAVFSIGSFLSHDYFTTHTISNKSNNSNNNSNSNSNKSNTKVIVCDTDADNTDNDDINDNDNDSTTNNNNNNNIESSSLITSPTQSPDNVMTPTIYDITPIHPVSVFMLHGTNDTVNRLEWGLDTARDLDRTHTHSYTTSTHPDSGKKHTSQQHNTHTTTTTSSSAAVGGGGGGGGGGGESGEVLLNSTSDAMHILFKAYPNTAHAATDDQVGVYTV